MREYVIEYKGKMYKAIEVTVLSIGAMYFGYFNGFDMWLGVDGIIYLL